MPDTKPPINLDDMDFGHTIRGLQKDDRVFERFVLKRLLGRGGMGVVWLATDQRLGRDVALKFAPEVVRWDDLAVEELKEETRKGLDLAHPNIVKIYDFLLDEEHAAISMEFIDGEHLGVLRARQPNKVFEPRQIIVWMGQLLDALDYAHRGAKVIHRDLKPANLMIDREGNLRVTDFGIARSISDALDRATMGGASTGTLAYMSPQQAAGRKPHVSDDLYSFGSTVYELLTGKPPFFTGNIVQQLSDEPVVSISERRREFGITTLEPLAPAWEQTIISCLAKRPEDRPAGAAEISEMLGFGPVAHGDGRGTIAVPAMPGAGAGVQSVPPFLVTPPPATLTGGAVQARAGMTETAAPGPLATRTPTTTAPVAVQTSTSQVETPPRKRGGIVWLFVLAVLLIIFVGLVAGGWWTYKHYGRQIMKYVTGKVSPNAANPEKPPSDTGDHNPPSDKPKPLVAGTGTGKTGGSATTPDHPEPRTDKPLINPTGTEPKPQPGKFTTIQNAINDAKAGDTVAIPPGTYEEQIKFKDGINLQAGERGKVIIQTDGRTGAVLMVDNCHGGSIKDLVLQHTGTDVVENVSWPVVMVKSSKVVFEDVVVQSGVGDGMSITGASKSEIRRCAFRNNAKCGLVIDSGASGVVEGCEARKNGEDGIDVRLTGSFPTLTGNTCVDNAGSGIVVKDGASANITQTNKLLGNHQAGVAAVGEGVSVTINGAECNDNLIGLIIKDKAKAQIVECMVRDSKEVGIHMDSPADGTEVTGSTVEKSIMTGIQVVGASGTSVTLAGNKSRHNGMSGIAVFGTGFRPTLEKNEAVNNGQYGILVAEGCGGTIRHNTVSGNNLASIGQKQPATDVVIQDNVADQGSGQ